jgi:two-component system, sensor histidine kinase and response regulator
MTKKILVIEDDEPLLNITAKLLSLHGFDTVSALDGIVGVQQARECKPDLIICDLMMPDLDGYGVLDILRKDPQTASVPFIIMTAKAERAAMRRGMELGADDYLTKPFTSDELLSAITARIEKQSAVANIARHQLDDLREKITLALPHEVRTPLNTIIGFSDILVTGASVMETKQITDVGQRISRAAWRLWHLVENYLAYLQIELLKTNRDALDALNATATPSPKLVIEDQAIQRAHQNNRAEDLVVNLLDVTAIRMSEGYLRKIISELVDNALKFSTAGSQVQVIGSGDTERYCLQIVDQGRGMTQEQIASVGAYMQFERILYEQQGAGLGLIISRELVELHGGQLTIESEPNIRTVISVTLPVTVQTMTSGPNIPTIPVLPPVVVSPAKASKSKSATTAKIGP